MSARRIVDGETLEALASNARNALETEQEYAREAFRAGHVVYYCRGPGYPVIVLETPADWEHRDSLSRSTLDWLHHHRARA